MGFVKQLKWRQNFEDFSPEQQKVLLALSDSRYLWRTLDRLESVTRLRSRALTETINDLIIQGLIRPSVSRARKEPVFGLAERVGEGRPMRQAG